MATRSAPRPTSAQPGRRSSPCAGGAPAATQARRPAHAFEGFPNQRMDMTDNESTQVNLRYTGQFGWGELEARVYHEGPSTRWTWATTAFWYCDGPACPWTPRRNTGASAQAATLPAHGHRHAARRRRVPELPPGRLVAAGGRRHDDGAQHLLEHRLRPARPLRRLRRMGSALERLADGLLGVRTSTVRMPTPAPCRATTALDLRRPTPPPSTPEVTPRTDHNWDLDGPGALHARQPTPTYRAGARPQVPLAEPLRALPLVDATPWPRS